MKKLSSLLLALAGSLACSGANGVPSHIVQPLPRELDPRCLLYTSDAADE